MTTENSLKAALVEPIGDADNAQNVTSIEADDVANGNIDEQENYEEEIMDGFGHGDFLMKHTDECCKKILRTLGK